MSEVGSGVRGGVWCQRWDLVSEVVSGVRGGIWCQRWDLVSEVVSCVSVRGGIIRKPLRFGCTFMFCWHWSDLMETMESNYSCETW